MYIKTLILLLTLNGMLSMHATCQVFNKEYKFITYGTKEGLSDLYVFKSIYDRHQFLWVATMNGLNKYDGRRFKTYTFTPGDTTGLRSIWITDLLLDQQGVLWVSTEWGICWYDEMHDRFHYLNTKKEALVFYKGPMCKGNDNSIWIAAEDGLKQINTVAKTITSTSLSRIPDPQCIQFFKGQVLVGTRGHGLFIYDPAKDNSIARYPLPLPDDAHIMGMFIRGDSVLYAATSEGLLKFDQHLAVRLFNKGIGELNKVVCDQLMCVKDFPSLLGSSQLLCGTYNDNLLVFDTRTNLFVERLKNGGVELSDYPAGVFNDVFSDGHILWISTDHGLTKLNLDVQDIVSHRIPALYNTNKRVLLKQIVATAGNNKTMWIAAGKGTKGILRYSSQNGELNSIQGPAGPGALYNRLYADSSEIIWAFGKNEIVLYDSKRGTFLKRIAIQRNALSAEPDGFQQFWIGTESGLAYFNGSDGSIQYYDCAFQGTAVENSSSPFPFPVMDMKVDGKANVWLTSSKYGLFCFNKKTHVFTPWRQPSSQAYETLNRCLSLTIAGDGKIWYATLSGLSCFDPVNQQFTNYNSSNGLTSTYVYAICNKDDRQIWGRGNTGVFCFDLATHAFKNFTLPEDHYGSFFYQNIAVVNERVTMGFEGGYTYFYHDTARSKKLFSSYITSCRVRDKPFYFDTAATGPISFSSHENTLQFEFTSIDYDDAASVRLYYKLDGLQDNWVKSGAQQYALYSNLPPGQYRFMVTTGDDAGVFAGQEAVFAFTIQKPFWQTTAFVLAVIALLSMIIYSIYQYRIRQIRLAYLVRSNISRNLHDEIGATLSSINIYSDVARKKIEVAATKELVDKIYSASAKAMESMNDIVWYVNPQNDALENILVRMNEHAVPLLESKSIRVHFDVGSELNELKLNMQQRQHLYRIFKEAINNILKYADATTVSIRFMKQAKLISMEIVDDGKGFVVDEKKGGNGLKNMHSRSLEMGGTMTLHSSPGNGTSIRIAFNIT